jgi:hypothetical protein
MSNKLYPGIVIFWVNSFWFQSNNFLPLQRESSLKNLTVGLIFFVLTVLTVAKVLYDLFFDFANSHRHDYSSHVTLFEWEGSKRISICSACGQKKEEFLKDE